MNQSQRIAVIGQGTVGFPLTLLLSKVFDVVGFDIDSERIQFLREKNPTIPFTCEIELLRSAQVYIVTVPIEVTDAGNVHTENMLGALDIVGQVLKLGDLIILESTVYIGFTDEIAAKRVAMVSGLKPNVDFQYGYSPERINPGDSINSIENIIKVVSGSTPQAVERIDSIYRTVIKAGTCRAQSISVAEASKLLENAQRFINIAIVNEMATEFNKLGLKSSDVLSVARTKWNFNFYSPGIVGGQCLELSTRLLKHSMRSKKDSESILDMALQINDAVIPYIVSRVENLVIKKVGNTENWKVLILGMTFKENYPATKGSKIIALARRFQQAGATVAVFDPHLNWQESQQEWELNCLPFFNENTVGDYQAVVVAQAHDEFKKIEFSKTNFPNTVIFDIKSVLKTSLVDESF